MLNLIDENRAVGCLLGLAIGDALGTTLEFKTRDSEPEVRDLVGGGVFGLKAGEWTDDTSMALCLADCIIANRGLDERDLLERFCRWWRDGENSVTGRCFDIGTTTRRALQDFERTGRTEAGPEDPWQAGNGSLMRLAPAVIFSAPHESEAVRTADRQSRTTHPAPVAHEACRLFAAILNDALTGQPKEHVFRARDWDGSEEIAEIARGSFRHKDRSQIRSSGYVVHTLEAALWAVDKADDFSEAVILAANLGDDADTVAAVAGQLAGALWTSDGIPERWRNQIAWADRLVEAARLLLDPFTPEDLLIWPVE